jgi:Ceroid-lipofuscinosis neuronal protein 5
MPSTASRLLLLALAALFSGSFRAARATCGPWVPVDLTTIKKASPADKISVVYLVAPLLECSDGKMLSWADAYHGGLAFKNENTGDELTVNFDASPSFLAAIAPKVVTLKNGTIVLEWENTGAVFIYHAPINYTYWNGYANTVGSVNGTVFNEFMFSYIAGANKTFHYYDIWSVYQSFPGKNWVKNQECFMFVWEAFKELARLGSPISAKTLPQSFVAIYSEDMPPKVNMADQSQVRAMAAWYQRLENDLEKKGYLGYLAALWEIVWDEVFYVRDNNYYYRVAMKWPFLLPHYVDVATPQTAHDTCGGMC